MRGIQELVESPAVAETPEARGLAAFGLPGSLQSGFVRISDDRWPAVANVLEREKLTGLAVAAVAADRLQLSPQAEADLLERQRQAMLHVLAIERALVDVAGALQGSAIDSVVLKGPAVAHAFYPDPSWRPFRDLDLLVRTRDWDRVCGILDDLGFRRALPEPRPGFDQRFGKAADFGANRSGVWIDLHRILVVGPFGQWMNPDELFERTAQHEIGGILMARLDDTAALLHAAAHAVLGWETHQLLALRDIAQIASAGYVDWDALPEWAGTWRLSGVLRYGLESASGTMDAELPEEAAPLLSFEPRGRERRAMAAYTGARRKRGALEVATVGAIPGLRAKLAYLRALLLPTREFLVARTASGSRPSYWRRWQVVFGWLAPQRRRGVPRIRGASR